MMTSRIEDYITALKSQRDSETWEDLIERGVIVMDDEQLSELKKSGVKPGDMPKFDDTPEEARLRLDLLKYKLEKEVNNAN